MTEQIIIYTIGHSNIQVEEFVQLLQAQGIRVLVDVRSSPYSKYTLQFNREALQVHPALAAAHLRYMFAGKMLGGRPDNTLFYDEEGHVLYEEVANTYTFQDGIAKLLTLAGQASTSVMCSEEDPHECHRRLLIGRGTGGRRRAGTASARRWTRANGRGPAAGGECGATGAGLRQ